MSVLRSSLAEDDRMTDLLETLIEVSSVDALLSIGFGVAFVASSDGLLVVLDDSLVPLRRFLVALVDLVKLAADSFLELLGREFGLVVQEVELFLFDLARASTGGGSAGRVLELKLEGVALGHKSDLGKLEIHCDF